MKFFSERKKKIHLNVRGRKADGGFTLVEIMLALCIFSIGLLAVASMQLTGTQRTASAKWHTGAAVWASDRIEKIVSLPYDHADLTDGDHGPVTTDQYTITWNVAEDDLINNTKTITVTVNWADRVLDRDVTFTYYKANI